MSSSTPASRHTGDGGFTVIELMVAITVLALIALGLVPLLIAGSKADLLAKQATQAKNLTSARLAQMRSLPYHVAYQNGQYVDLLDEYYTNTTTASITPTNGSGTYVASGTIPGQSRAGAYFQVHFGPSALPAGYTQDVYSQFLQGSATGDTVVTPPTTPPTTYTSASATNDAPPALLLGVTIVTTYGSASHTFRTFTELSDTGHDKSLVIGQASATALSVQTHAADGTTLSGVAAQVGVAGTLSTSTDASASVTSAAFKRLDPTGSVSYADVVGGVASAVSPPDLTSANSKSDLVITAGSGSCSAAWGVANPTSAADVWATVAGGQPRIPTDVETVSTPAKAVTSTLGVNGSSNCGAAFSLTNNLPGSSLVPTLGLSPSNPQVLVPDPGPGHGNTLTMAATASVDTPALGSGTPVTSKATLTYNPNYGPIELFPGLSFVTNSAYGRALVVIQLTSAAITCTATSSTATTSYAGNLLVWEQPSPGTTGSYVSVPLNWSSGAPPSLPARTTTATWVGGVGVPLSNWIQNWQAGTVVEQTPLSGTASIGSHTIPSVLTIDTQPTLLTTGTLSANPDSDLLIDVGQLACASEDNR